MATAPRTAASARPSGRRRGTRWRGLAVLLGIMPILLGPAAQPAVAHHDASNPTWWGSSYSENCIVDPLAQCVANNTLHLYLFNSTIAQFREDATVRALGLYDTNSEVSAAANTTDFDVYITYANRPDVNAFAWGQCPPNPAPPLPPVQYGGSNAEHTRWCRPQYVYWNTWSAASDKVATLAQRNYVGCHEIGHTLGLRHRTGTSCMVGASSGPQDPNSVVPSIQSPAASDYSRIDAHYPLFNAP